MPMNPGVQRTECSIARSVCVREVACSTLDRNGKISNHLTSDLSRYFEEVLPAQFSWYVHKGGIVLTGMRTINFNDYITNFKILQIS